MEKTDYYGIGQRIRRIRKARRLSQEQLAEAVNISVTHMSHIETGNTKLSLAVLVALAQALSVQTDILLFEYPEQNRSRPMDTIIELLDSCTDAQLCVICEIMKVAKESIDTYL